jgi:hypothetical protein
MASPNLTRRKFCTTLLACPWVAKLVASRNLFAGERENEFIASFNVAAIDRARILSAAKKYLRESPLTITASSSSGSAGGRHYATVSPAAAG